MTPHIEAIKEDISPLVIMPGDPLRAKYIAEKYLTNYKLVNEVRGMLAYTGEYKGKRITIMGSGMGIPSMGIYSYELYNFYDVDTIIRIGTSGSYSSDINVKDIFLVTESYSESTYGLMQNGDNKDTLTSTGSLNNVIINIAQDKNIDIKSGRVYSTDVFYTKNDITNRMRDEKKCACVEMESFALFHNALELNKKAATLLTISDSFITKEELSSSEREQSLDKMIELALDTLVSL